MCCGEASFDGVTTTVCNKDYLVDVWVNGTVFNDFRCSDTELKGAICVDYTDCTAENFCCGEAVLDGNTPPKQVCGM